MGKEEEGTRVKTKEKSQHLEPTASGDRDSSQHMVTSHQRQREEAVTGRTTSKDCEHFCYDTEEMGVVLATIESLKQDPACEDCLKETAKRRSAKRRAAGIIIMCTECRRCFCTRLRHARRHARNADHPVGLQFDQPHCAYCYKCRHFLCLRSIIEAVRAKGRASVPADGRGCVFRGTPYLGNACYAIVVMQCLLVLDKLRIWMLGPNAPTGSIGMALKEIFMDTKAGNYARDMLKLQKLVESVGALSSEYTGRALQDSHEFLSCLLDGLKEEEKLRRPPNTAEGVLTVIESIFLGQKTTTPTCKRCGYTPVICLPFYELALTLPPKAPLTRNVVSSPRPKKIWLRRWEETQRKRISPERLATSESNFEMDQTIADSADSHIPGLQSVAMEKGPMLLEVDSSEEDSSSLPSIKDCLAFYFKKEAVEWLCENCSDVPEQPSTIRSKDGGQMVASINGNTLVDRGQTEQSDRKGCPSEQIEPDNSAHQVGENQNKQNVHSDKKVVISKLPPVLIVRVLRSSNNLLKAIGHVKFEENLDVGPYVDPRSQGKDNSSYRLAGVIEHIGNSLDSGRYDAYVRRSRIGSRRQSSSGSSSWLLCTGDGKQVSIEEVLKCEAFLLLYERIEAAE